jgi:ferrous iron transport protein A
MSTTIPAAAIDLRANRTGIIARFTNEALATKLLDIGIKPGARLRLVRRSPFGGCWYVKVDRQCVALRKHELACIILQ